MPAKPQGSHNVLINIRTLMDYYSVSKEQVFTAARISVSTFNLRCRKPREFKISELEGIAKKLHTSVGKLVGSPKDLFS